MFSLIDLADAKQNIYSDRDDVYTPAKNEMSFELSQMTTTDRGNALNIWLQNVCDWQASTPNILAAQMILTLSYS